MAPSRPQLVGTFGMVASTHWLASGAGMAMLERGGNAYDAAVAAGFVLQVVEPHLNGPGGEVPIMHWSAANSSVEVVCGQGPAPQAASIARFRDLGLDVVPGTGLLAACVPGAFAAWTTLLEQHGTMELADVLEPAIGYARGGYPVAPGLSATVGRVRSLFEEQWPTSAAAWLSGDGPPAAGSMRRNLDLAHTFDRLIAAGAAKPSRETRIAAARDAFYRGFVAEEIARFVAETAAMDTSGRRHAGLLTADDLAAFEATVEPSLSFSYAGKVVHKAATWTQGLVLLQQLALLAHTDIAEVTRDSGRFVHTVVEAAKLAFADREAWYGDPAFVEVPVGDLLDPAYDRDRAALIGEEASFELRPGAPGGRTPLLPTQVVAADADAGAGEPTQADTRRARRQGAGSGDTVHLDVVDRWGNLVSATPSGAWLQSSPHIPTLGFCLGTRAQMFWLTEGLPSSLAPGKRPRSTLTPGLVVDDDGPWLAFGTPGGDNQDQWALTFLVTLLHHEPDLQLAIDAPTFNTEAFPNSFFPRASRPGSLTVEGHTARAAIDELQRRGHDLEVGPPWSQGWLSAVGRDPASGALRGAANPRGRQGYVVGR